MNKNRQFAKSIREFMEERQSLERGDTVVNERKMNRTSAQRIKLFGYEPIFKEIDFAKKDLKRQGYSNSKAQEFLFNFYGDEDPKIVQKIKEGMYESVLNEVVSKTYKIPTQRGTLHLEVEEDPDGVIVDVIFNRVMLSTIDVQFPTGKVEVKQRYKKVKLKESVVNEAKSDNMYVVIDFHEKGGAFVMSTPSSQKDAEGYANEFPPHRDIIYRGVLKVSDARKIRRLSGGEYLK